MPVYSTQLALCFAGNMRGQKGQVDSERVTSSTWAPFKAAGRAPKLCQERHP